MFIRNSLNPVQMFANNQFFNLLNLDSLPSISGRKIAKYDKTVSDKIAWARHKRKILWNWINVHFAITETFINRLDRYIKKLNIQTTPKEMQFLFEIKGLYFATWRPLKEIVVRFNLDKKETIFFFESGGSVFEVSENNGKTTNQAIVSGDFYFSNNRIYVCDEYQKIKEYLEYSLITNIEFSQFGTILTYGGQKILLRSENKYMPYVVFQRVLPSFKLNINKIEGLYNYFDFWNKLLLKIN